jgi:hypothetical protein
MFSLFSPTDLGVLSVLPSFGYESIQLISLTQNSKLFKMAAETSDSTYCRGDPVKMEEARHLLVARISPLVDVPRELGENCQ